MTGLSELLREGVAGLTLAIPPVRPQGICRLYSSKDQGGTAAYVEGGGHRSAYSPFGGDADAWCMRQHP